jgi:hypothetical protein
MALAPTSKAIGAVTAALQTRITSHTNGIPVTVGRPEKNATGRGLNLFLYEISYDPHLKNFPLDEGQKPPLWLVLKYILTAFEREDESDSAVAHEVLGLGMRAIYHDDLLRLEGLDAFNIVPALESNPEELHVTFDDAPSDLLAKLMEGGKEKFRLSIAFQVRPVMIASTEPPAYSLLVGVDYTQDPPEPVVIDDTQPPSVTASKYVGLEVIPSLGAIISEIKPTGFEVDEEVVIKGTDLHLSNLSVRLGTIDLPVTFQRPDELRFKVDSALVNGATISAGSHPISVIQTLSPEKKRGSNMLIGNLVPTLTTVTVVSKTLATSPPPPPNSVFATIKFTGVLLGNVTDDTVVALYQNGKVVKMLDVLTSSASQTARRLEMVNDDAVPQAEYMVILRVNGQQALLSPKINFVLP